MHRDWVDTDRYTCEGCGGTACKYYQIGGKMISRKAEVWGNADRDLDPVIKVTCKDCLREWDAQWNGHL